MRVLAVLVVATVSIMSCSVSSQVSPTETLVQSSWRLHGEIFATAPSEGFPIQFSADGVVETSNLSVVSEWAWGEGDRLHLLNSSGGVAYKFEWRECDLGGFYLGTSVRGAHQLEFVIAPQGLDYWEFFGNTGACVQPPTN